MRRLGTVLDTSDLPLAELCAVRLDGCLFPIDDCFVPVDHPDCAEVRAAALARHAPTGAVAAGLSAAWIHGVLASPPVMHEVYLDSRHRAPSAYGRVMVREIAAVGDDVVRLGGMAVLTPLRALVDYARLVDDYTETERRVLDGLATAGHVTPAQWRRRLSNAGHLPHKRRALARIEEAVGLRG